MSERKYCHLSVVDTGEELRVAKTEGVSVYVGDMVSIDTGEIGTVVVDLFSEIGGDEYTFIEKLVPIYESVGVYRRAWTREEADETP